jgi:hypothetical protein
MISEREYCKMRAKIEDEYHRNVDALDRIWFLSHPLQAPPQKTTPNQRPAAIAKPAAEVPNAADGEVLFSKRGAVRAAIHGLSGHFGSKDIRAALTASDPEASRQITDNQLSSIIARLAELEEIYAVIPKTGRTPAVYALGAKPKEAMAS